MIHAPDPIAIPDISKPLHTFTLSMREIRPVIDQIVEIGPYFMVANKSLHDLTAGNMCMDGQNVVFFHTSCSAGTAFCQSVLPMAGRAQELKEMEPITLSSSTIQMVLSSMASNGKVTLSIMHGHRLRIRQEKPRVRECYMDIEHTQANMESIKLDDQWKYMLPVPSVTVRDALKSAERFGVDEIKILIWETGANAILLEILIEGVPSLSLPTAFIQSGGRWLMRNFTPSIPTDKDPLISAIFSVSLCNKSLGKALNVSKESLGMLFHPDPPMCYTMGLVLNPSNSIISVLIMARGPDAEDADED